MASPLVSKLSSASRRLVYLFFLVFAGTVAVLAMMIPAGAIPMPIRARLHRRAAIRRAALPRLGRRQQFWHTEGNRILDERNREMRIAGVNWSGFETRRGVPGGLTSRDYREVLRTIKAQGYNTVRLPLSNEMVESPSVPSEIAFTGEAGAINGDLKNLNSLEILDRIVAEASKLDLKIILDNHRSEAGDSAEASGLWYTPEYPEEAWLSDWTALAKRYRREPAVIGMDLRNEPHNAQTTGACWDCGGARDWHHAAERAGAAILAVNPRLLIFVEGVDAYGGDSYWWGGNLEGVRRSPVRLPVPGRLVYSAHVYGPAEYRQPWFSQATTPATLRQVWRRHWAFVSEGGLAPVWIGEFGAPNNDAELQSTAPGSEGQWFSEFTRFLGEESALHWTYWGVNGEDRYGLLDKSYAARPLSGVKARALAQAMVPAGRSDLRRLAEPSTAPGESVTAQLPDEPVAFAAADPTDGFGSVDGDNGAAEAARMADALAAHEQASLVGARSSPAARVGRALQAKPSSLRGPGRESRSSSAPEVQHAVANGVQQAVTAAMQGEVPRP